MKHLWLTLVLGSVLFAPVDSLDRAVQRAVQSGRRPGLEQPVRLVNRLGDRVVVVSALLGIAVLDPVAGPATVRTILIAMVPTNAVVEGTKLAVNRIRPDGERKRANSSFPSSHAANAFAVAWVLARRWPRGRVVFLVAATGVALARIYLNRHYMSDVVVGSAIGLLSAHWVLRWRAGRASRSGAERAGGRD